MIFFSGLIIILLASSVYLSAPDPIQILVEPSFISGNDLPLERNYLGVVPQFLDSYDSYSKYFKDGALTAYQISDKQIVSAIRMDGLFVNAFNEWYNDWCNDPRFSVYGDIYVNRDGHSVIYRFAKTTYPNFSILSGSSIENLNIEWANSLDSDIGQFSTVDFTAKANKIMLYNADFEIWGNLYNDYECMFRYYDISTNTIGFWSPEDLTLNYEVRQIANMLNRGDKEVLPIFTGWILKYSHIRFKPFYFNYVDHSTFCEYWY